MGHSRRRWLRTGLIGAVVGAVLAVAGAGVASAEPSGVPTNSNKGSVYGMPQPDGSVAGKNGDMFRVTWKDDAGATSYTLSYCVEASVQLAILKPYQPASWSEAARNSFDANSAKVKWVLDNSYPTVSSAQLGAASGIGGLSDQDAITATQFAIWNLTDPTLAGRSLFPSPTTIPQDLATYPRSTVIQSLMVWLLENAQSSGSEPTSPLAISPATSQVSAGGLAGPFTLATTSGSGVTVTTTAGVVVDAAGVPFAGPLHDGDRFWVDARSLAAGTGVSLTASAAGAQILPGTIITGANPSVSTQTIVVASAATFGAISTSASLQVTDAPLGSIAIHKQDADDPSRALAGAVFDILDANGTGIATLTTDATGDASATELPFGVYSVVERTAPDGYQRDATARQADVRSTDPVTLTIANTLMPAETGTITIHKQDATDPGKALAGAEFDIFDNDGTMVATVTTDSDGDARSPQMPFGAYTVVERVAPQGYQLDTSPRPARIDSSAPTLLTISNTPAAAAAPAIHAVGGLAATGGTDQSAMGLVAALLAITGAALIVVNRRRQAHRGA